MIAPRLDLPGPPFDSPSGDRPDGRAALTDLAATPDVPAQEGTLGPEGDAIARPTPEELAAVLPSHLLDGGETVLLLLKPSLLFVVLAPLRTLTTLVVFTVLLAAADAYLTAAVYRDEIFLVGMAAIGLRLFWQFLEWLSRAYVLTDRRLIRVRGVLTVQILECPLPRIQHTELVRILREQLFGLGTLAFTTAGTGAIDAAWEMINRPGEVQQEVVRAIRRYGGRGGV
ncbi:MAG: PH domain-containing protein [Planctomycetota bacterium]